MSKDKKKKEDKFETIELVNDSVEFGEDQEVVIDLEDLGLDNLDFENLKSGKLTVDDLRKMDLKELGIEGADLDQLEAIGFELETQELEVPDIRIESEIFDMRLLIKKDYSDTLDLEERKKECIKDLFDFVGEFINTDEFVELMNSYDE
ncbi:hypothetical protein [Methanobrevibacter filiformis]|uniref:Uncharacterized protein n=1 Tax=Methanobrevibacter filiformis TaxID=55758 RepID=A0A166D0E1_9EURY|nr:hypothetical protein [Methanobrevibacter filiformis]KZX15070.1 hypothetical protein MBFIL_07460 [Methanobrevibacter filiformis]